MKRPVPVESASPLIDEKIKEFGDWRGKVVAKVREIMHAANPGILEGREGLSGTVSFGVSKHSGCQRRSEFFRPLRAPWNTRRISTTLLRTR
jgi:hypothetical protein